jgi:hypothetical protein
VDLQYSMGQGLSWNGLVPSFSSKKIGGSFQPPSVPSNCFLNWSSNSSRICIVMGSGKPIVFDNTWKINFAIHSVRDLHDNLGSIVCAHWLLGY